MDQCLRVDHEDSVASSSRRHASQVDARAAPWSAELKSTSSQVQGLDVSTSRRGKRSARHLVRSHYRDTPTWAGVARHTRHGPAGCGPDQRPAHAVREQICPPRVKSGRFILADRPHLPARQPGTPCPNGRRFRAHRRGGARGSTPRSRLRGGRARHSHRRAMAQASRRRLPTRKRKSSSSRDLAPSGAGRPAWLAGSHSLLEMWRSLF